MKKYIDTDDVIIHNIKHYLQMAFPTHYHYIITLQSACSLPDFMALHPIIFWNIQMMIHLKH